jgi:hypothetical protein
MGDGSNDRIVAMRQRSVRDRAGDPIQIDQDQADPDGRRVKSDQGQKYQFVRKATKT